MYTYNTVCHRQKKKLLFLLVVLVNYYRVVSMGKLRIRGKYKETPSAQTWIILIDVKVLLNNF